ncbi:hypothetical protein [Limnoglobus roseus]|uniref:Uncharacterized protein n=1 Tax=Limnoglobus roseus TaxID=2598579 RepID=A0A5C1A705_9BACT|nr:hypothetical protein [Limnoglobus roseus]QEL13786.1 hypothetical protein PX52LOC_00644 [Limnoglobus roseus]
MNIQSAGTYRPTASETLATDQTQRVASSAGEAKPATEAKTSFAPTTDLSQLLAAVKQLPDVRGDVVQSATARLNNGELSTPAAAQDTAQAALDDLRLS